MTQAAPGTTAGGIPHIRYIDGIRGFAMLGVLAAHIALHAHLDGPFARIILEGAHGVDMFFIVSGFCLAYPTLKSLGTDKAARFNVADYAAKRLVRICPPFYIAIAVFVALAALSALRGTTPLVNVPPFFELVKQMLFFDGHTQLIDPSFWTLMVEFRWYFAFPLLLVLWLKSPRAFVAVGIVSVCLYAFTRSRGLDLGTLPGFMLGIVAADVHIGGRIGVRLAGHIKRWAPLLFVISAAAGIAAEGAAHIPGFDGNDIAFPYQPTILGWQLAAFFAVVMAGTLPAVRWIFTLRWLMAAGVASYSIYLLHEPLVSAVLNKIHGPAGYACAAVAGLAAGSAFWYVAERPFTTGSLRRPLTELLAPFVRRAIAFAGVSEMVPLPVIVPALHRDTPPDLAPRGLVAATAAAST